MFLLPGLLITWYVTNTPIPPEYATEIKRYLFARQHPEDGGWGLHIEAHSSVFGTAMNYVALRIVGVSEDDPRMIKARGLLHKFGGAIYGPHWAKAWLSILGVMEWEGVNPVPPEIWYVVSGSIIELPLTPWSGFFPTGCPSLLGDGGFISAKSSCLCLISGPRNGPSLSMTSRNSCEKSSTRSHMTPSTLRTTATPFTPPTTTIPRLGS